jgi:hypothetical protein
MKSNPIIIRMMLNNDDCHAIRKLVKSGNSVLRRRYILQARTAVLSSRESAALRQRSMEVQILVWMAANSPNGRANFRNE